MPVLTSEEFFGKKEQAARGNDPRVASSSSEPAKEEPVKAEPAKVKKDSRKVTLYFIPAIGTTATKICFHDKTGKERTIEGMKDGKISVDRKNVEMIELLKYAGLVEELPVEEIDESVVYVMAHPDNSEFSRINATINIDGETYVIENGIIHARHELAKRLKEMGYVEIRKYIQGE